MPDFIQQFDEQALVWIAENVRCAVLDPFLKFYTQLGNTGMLFIVLGLLMLFWKPTRKAGFSALCAMLIGLVVVNFTIKPLVSRPRPWLVIENFVNLVPEHDPNSFPSGHTNAGFAFAIAVCLTKTMHIDPYRCSSCDLDSPGLKCKHHCPYEYGQKLWMKVTAVCMAAVMGLSRLYVGVHFPSDVLAGAVIGSLCGVAGAWIIDRWVWNRLPARLQGQE